MKQLTTLIKLHKQKLDVMRRELAVLEDGLAKFVQAEKDLEAQILSEQALAARSPEAGYMYAAFAKAAIIKRKNLKRSQLEIQQKIKIVRDGMAEEFANQKKYEILKKKKLEAELKERARKETIALDEMAAVQHIRKNSI